MPREHSHISNSAPATIRMLDSLPIFFVFLTLCQLSLGRLLYLFLRIYSLSIALLVIFSNSLYEPIYKEPCCYRAQPPTHKEVLWC